MRILLVEPGYKNKYPPLGLMKISTFHKLLGDSVSFVKGCDKSAKLEKWDRIYVSTLFTFQWNITIKTIKYYRAMVDSAQQLIVGGVMATLLKNEIKDVIDVTIIPGLLDKPHMLNNKSKIIIDHLVPDYSILQQTDFLYGHNDSYVGYATRGCPNRCAFCAVSRIEPTFCGYLPLKKQIHSIDERFGPKRHLMLLDNNVLASHSFDQIIDDIKELGFTLGAKFRNGLRHVDFNQGLDVRLLDEHKMARLSEIPIKPLRIAFDHIELKNQYIDKVHLAAKFGLLNLSNYILYNYEDTPEDFYERLRINVELNKELGTKIYSFPMKYIPLDAKDRKYIGKHWNKKLIRGVQCILLATMGKVGLKKDFFEAAFGRDASEFIEIAMMPERYIIYREKYKENEAKIWRNALRSLTPKEKKVFMQQTTHDGTKIDNIRLQNLLEA